MCKTIGGFVATRRLDTPPEDDEQEKSAAQNLIKAKTHA
jgi:hypothetical protein